MENDNVVKRVYVGSCLIGQLWKSWNDFVNDCFVKIKIKSECWAMKKGSV